MNAPRLTAPAVLCCFLLLGLALGLGARLLQAQAVDAPREQKKVSALYARIDGTINPAQEDFLKQALSACTQQGHDLLVLGLDTPGGLGKSMRDMLKLILNAPVPVVTWVGPKGARAASAGVFLVAASAVASMSPQTNIGSATPVAMGGKEVPEEMARKIKNDFLSLIRSVAKARGRNVDWYEKAIEEAVNITATEAVTNRVVDLLAASPRDLLEQVGAKGIAWNQTEITFGPDEFSIEKFEPGFRHSFLSWLLHPQIAYFLLLGGIAGLFFELSNPGAIFPGVFGAICLLLALYAMAVLPTNVTGLLLIFLGLVLFILEIKVVSFGLLSLGGVVCLLVGSIILFRFEYGMAALPLKVILPTVIGVSAAVGLALYLVTRAQVKPRQTGSEAMIGLTGEVISWQEAEGRVRVRGEIWRARTPSGARLSQSTQIRVTSMRGLLLEVEPKEK